MHVNQIQTLIVISVQAIVIYSNLSLDKNKRWRTVGGLAHSREGLGLVRPPPALLAPGIPTPVLIGLYHVH